MVQLRIDRFLASEGLNRKQLGKLTGIKPKTLKAYAEQDIELNTDNVADIRAIAATFKIPVAKLVEPQKKQSGVSFKILERAKTLKMELGKLAEDAQVTPLALAVYSTQVLLWEQWENKTTQAALERISKFLDTTLQDLTIAEELPISLWRMSEFLEEKGMTSAEFALLYDVPEEDLALLASQPMSLERFDRLRKPNVSPRLNFHGDPEMERERFDSLEEFYPSPQLDVCKRFSLPCPWTH